MPRPQINVFISSRMEELKGERAIVKEALAQLGGVDTFVFEADAGPRSESIRETYRAELRNSHLYVGLFWKGYGPATIEEFEYAKELGLDALIFERRSDEQYRNDPDIDEKRDPELREFLARTVGDLDAGHVSQWFDTKEELHSKVTDGLDDWRNRIVLNSLKAAANPDRKVELSLLRKVQDSWVNSRHSSLNEGIKIPLGGEPDLGNEWYAVNLRKKGHRDPFPPESTLADLFDAYNQEILIAGEAGSGKSIALQELTKVLVERCFDDPTAAVPVVFDLETFGSDEESVADWMVSQLRGPNYKIAKNVARSLISESRILPVLEGFESVPADRQSTCAEAITTFKRDADPPLRGLIVTVRAGRDEHLPSIDVSGAIRLLPLSMKQVTRYLNQLGEPASRLAQEIESDETLGRLAQNPLWLTMISKTYLASPGLMESESVSSVSLADRLFDDYTRSMFDGLGEAETIVPEPEFRSMLGWVAQNMTRQKASVLWLESLQPAWLDRPKDRKAYFRSTRLFEIWLGIAIAFFSALTVMPLAVGLALNVFLIMLVVGVIARRKSFKKSWQTDIIPIDIPTWSWARARKGLLVGGLAAAGLAFALVLMVYLLEGASGIPSLTIILLATFLPFGLWFGLMRGGYTHQPVEQTMTPNEGMQLTRKAAKFAGLRLAMPWALLGVSVATLILLLSKVGPDYPGLGQSLVDVLPIAVVLGLPLLGAGFLDGYARFGGVMVKRNRALLEILRRGGYVPDDIVRFLNEAVSLELMQRIGGGYRFIHGFFQEEFAARSDGDPPVDTG